LAAEGHIKVAVNIEYLNDILNQVGDTVTFYTASPSDSILVKEDDVTIVTMPMCVKWD
jgi:DNA polymerase III sliding clamp (beta) subunit (PCNA family)